MTRFLKLLLPGALFAIAVIAVALSLVRIVGAEEAQQAAGMSDRSIVIHI